MAIHIDYYEHRDDLPLTCPDCGWTGTAGQCHREWFDALFHLECPNCPKIIAIISYPTLEEGLKRGDPSALRRKEFLDRLERLCLKSVDQLPDLKAANLNFLWDCETEQMTQGTEEHWTVLRLDDSVIWREPEVWEGYRRFYEVKEILKQKYGPRFESLKPTQASLVYLYGDRLINDDDPF